MALAVAKNPLPTSNGHVVPSANPRTSSVSSNSPILSSLKSFNGSKLTHDPKSAKLTTDRLVNGSPCDWIDMIIEDLDLKPKIDAMVREFLEKSLSSQDVPSTSDRRLIELENQVQRLMEAHLAPKPPVQVNKITSLCEICSGPQTLNTAWKIPKPSQPIPIENDNNPRVLPYYTTTVRGDENPIHTLGDYSKPSHKGYRNTIDLPDGNNVVPL
nr:MAK10-like protein [Tanacetum cinerariifolium]